MHKALGTIKTKLMVLIYLFLTYLFPKYNEVGKGDDWDR
jgi:hypothetical protein